MTDKTPPQWAIDTADNYIHDITCISLNEVAWLLAAERERCAKICEEIMEGLSAYEAWHRLFKIAVARIRES